MRTSPTTKIKTRLPEGYPRWKKHPAGVTLAELVVVLVIIGIFMSLVLPRLGGVSDREKMRTAMRRLAGQAAEAYSQATTQSRPWFWCLDIDNKIAWLSTVRPDREGFAGQESELLKLPDSVQIVDIVHPTLGMMKEGRLSFGYWPQGGNEPGTIHLMIDDEQNMTLFIRPYLGRTEIKEGYLREEIS